RHQQLRGLRIHDRCCRAPLVRFHPLWPCWILECSRPSTVVAVYERTVEERLGLSGDSGSPAAGRTAIRRGSPTTALLLRARSTIPTSALPRTSRPPPGPLSTSSTSASI